MKKNFKNIMLCCFIALIISACEQNNTAYKEKANDPEFFHRSMKRLTDVIVHDIFSPPVASRIYAYPSIAAYEIIAQTDPTYKSMQGQLTNFNDLPLPNKEEMCYPLAAVHAFLVTGKALVFSEDKMQIFQEEIYQEFKDTGMPESVFENSIAYGDQVAEHIMAWAAEDNYKQTRTFPKFTVTDEAGRWKPTPPDYMEGIEPHWNQIRPFIIDSATQFVPIESTEFSLEKNSQFYKEVMQVYETVNKLDEEQKEIAKFWDCNPYVSTHRGHAMFAIKKITPGGHWIGITSIVTRKVNADFLKTVETYAVVSIALADGFISCWDEKYRSNLIRPETVINEHIDEDWLPLLQTPPFPEYTSGHSVISASAAVTLTNLLGENFAFIDSTEVEYGLPVREYESFFDASEEAAISRLYGGIHYMPAIENGVEQGKKVGNFVMENLVTRQNNLAEIKEEEQAE